MNALTALLDFLGATALENWQRLQQWTPAAFRALTDLLWRILLVSLLLLAGSLAASGISHTRMFLPWVGILYVVVILLMLRTRQALNAAGLLLATDAAIDIFKGVTPLGWEKLRAAATLGLDFTRLKELATLQLVGRLVFNVLLFELLVLLAFSIIPVWTYPQLAGHLILGGIIYALLSTPWGQTSPFRPLTNWIGLGCVGIIALFGAVGFWEEPLVRSWYDKFSSSDSPFPLWLIALGLILLSIFGGSLVPKKLRKLFAVAGLMLLAWWLFATPPSPRPVSARSVVAVAGQKSAPTKAPALEVRKVRMDILNFRDEVVTLKWKYSAGGYDSVTREYPPQTSWTQWSYQYPGGKWEVFDSKGTLLKNFPPPERKARVEIRRDRVEITY